MLDKSVLVLGLPAWFWLLIVPFCMFIIMLGWLSLALRRQKLSTFTVKGLGLSISISAGDSIKAVEKEV